MCLNTTLTHKLHILRSTSRRFAVPTLSDCMVGHHRLRDNKLSEHHHQHNHARSCVCFLLAVWTSNAIRLCLDFEFYDMDPNRIACPNDLRLVHFKSNPVALHMQSLSEAELPVVSSISTPGCALLRPDRVGRRSIHRCFRGSRFP